jgi:iron-sulfur cluster repair protein YtfE (RIC family)
VKPSTRLGRMSECDLDTSVPDWVIEHPATLAVFQECGIDYCCGGKSLAYACRHQGLDEQVVLEKLLGCLHENHTDTAGHGDG